MVRVDDQKDKKMKKLEALKKLGIVMEEVRTLTIQEQEEVAKVLIEKVSIEEINNLTNKIFNRFMFEEMDYITNEDTDNPGKSGSLKKEAEDDNVPF